MVDDLCADEDVDEVGEDEANGGELVFIEKGSAGGGE